MILALTYDPSITFGNVLQVVTILICVVATYYGAMQRLASLELIIKQHGAILETHSERMTSHEERLMELVGDVQRLIGVMEERRARSR